MGDLNNSNHIRMPHIVAREQNFAPAGYSTPVNASEPRRLIRRLPHQIQQEQFHQEPARPSTHEQRVELMFNEYLDMQKRMHTELNSKMDKMHADLSMKIDRVASHVHKMDKQLHFIEERVKKNAKDIRQNGKDMFRMNVNTNIGFNRFQDKLDAQEATVANLSTHINTSDARACSGSSWEVHSLDSKVDCLHHEIKEKLSTLIEKLDQVSVRGDKLEEQTNKNAGAIDNLIALWGSPEKREIKMNMINWIPDKVSNFDSSDSEGDALFVPKHRQGPISEVDFAKFEKQVRMIPPDIDFDKAWERYHLDKYFYCCRESGDDIKKLFYETRRKTNPPLKKLVKKEDPGEFLVSFSIQRTDFDDVLCDSGACMSLMSRTDANRLGLDDFEPARTTIKLADSSLAKIIGIARDLNVQIGNCFIPTDFLVLDSNRDCSVLLGRPFLATVGAVIDSPRRSVTFTFVDKKVSYEAIPNKKAGEHQAPISAKRRRKEAHENWKAKGEQDLL